MNMPTTTNVSTGNQLAPTTNKAEKKKAKPLRLLIDFIVTQWVSLRSFRLRVFNKTNIYRFVFSPITDEHKENDDIIAVHGFGVPRLGRSGGLVKVTNITNGKSFQAKVVGAGSKYGLKSKSVMVLNTNQRTLLGLTNGQKRVNIAVHADKNDLEKRMQELRYMQITLAVTVAGFLISLFA